MSVSRHLVDPQIIEMLDMPSLDLTDETLPEIRVNPLFTGELVPPPPFPVTEAFAPAFNAPAMSHPGRNPPKTVSTKARPTKSRWNPRLANRYDWSSIRTAWLASSNRKPAKWMKPGCHRNW